MRRLIDADALIEKLVISNTAHSQNTREASLLNRDVRMVMDMPTAYDVKKVVADLEQLKIETKKNNYKAVFALDVAIDIVRKGGIE